MSEDKSEPVSEPFEPNIDWYLAALVDDVNGLEKGEGFGVTLTVSGQLVSGTMISGSEYFDLLGDAMVRGLPEDKAEAVKAYYSGPGDLYGPERDDDHSSPVYVHLKDARYFGWGGNPVPASSGFLWRGKLTAVDAFSLGTLSSEDPEA